MIFSVVLFIVSITMEIQGHGYLSVPPSRNAMWRYGFDNPVDYQDNELFCGGYTVQFEINDGQCGTCGDDFREEVPRPHEDGGYYGNGIIGRTYSIGQEIDVEIEITANHMGWMELKICPKEEGKAVTQECLDKHPLGIVGQSNTRFVIPEDSKMSETFKWKAQLPETMTCSQCVVQWTYVAGNNWGECDNGTSGMGCGPQETFVNCADVSIFSSVRERLGHNINPKTVYYRGNAYSNVVKKNESVPEEELKPLVIRSQLCIPVGEHKKKKGSYDSCRVSCLKYPPTCPLEMCTCVHNCEAVGEFSKLPKADIFCLQNCLVYPSNCPEKRCKCN